MQLSGKGELEELAKEEEIRDLPDTSNFKVPASDLENFAAAQDATSESLIVVLPIERYVKRTQLQRDQRHIALILTCTLSIAVVIGMVGLVWFDAAISTITQIVAPLAALVAVVVTFYYKRGGTND